MPSPSHSMPLVLRKALSTGYKEQVNRLLQTGEALYPVDYPKDYYPPPYRVPLDAQKNTLIANEEHVATLAR